MIRFLLALVVACVATAAAAQRPTLQEIPTLERTHQGLPPVEERVPEEPLVVDLAEKGREAGVHGGDLDTIIPRVRDIRLINVWGYARLVGYDENFELQPDILLDYQVEEGRIFTFRLRRGHKWSDGAPFTSEDFRYWFEDILSNPALTPEPFPFMLAGGAMPRFEVIDEVTVRFTWSQPNPRFLPELALARDPFIYRPSHYLKRFHEKYGDLTEIGRLAAEARVAGWAPLHNLRDEMYDATNPELPSLQPWVVTPSASDRRVVMVRNPYFHRVTADGQQLPFIDQVVMSVSDGSLIATKVQAGEADLQSRGLVFADLAVLKRGEGQRGYETRLWPQANASAMAIYPNLTVADPVLRDVFRDKRFRQALSLAVDRSLLNRVLYFGLGKPSANTLLEVSPLYQDDFEGHTGFDVEAANALLDGMGLTKRNADDIRLLPDGRPLEIIVETTGEDAIHVDALELIRDTWREIGVSMYPRPSQRDVLRNRAFSGELAMAIFNGYDNGLPSADTPPDERVPVSTDFLSGPAWGAHALSGGTSGEEPDYPPAVELMSLYGQWLDTADSAAREAAWNEILKLHAEEVFSIGTVEGVVQPVVVRNTLKNVPEEAIYGWDPGANYGLYRMDEFFFEGGEG